MQNLEMERNKDMKWKIYVTSNKEVGCKFKDFLSTKLLTKTGPPKVDSLPSPWLGGDSWLTTRLRGAP